jgi:hypothetical protein
MIDEWSTECGTHSFSDPYLVYHTPIPYRSQSLQLLVERVAQAIADKVDGKRECTRAQI